uniref:histidine kinase n=1 Tax=Magnetococcus massalia (strain MO-1) TaxID=451514 RepID=A0A1S7LGS2_MAGMO|nr:putative Histidine kinase with two SBP_bac_3 (bacterial extracellular solute-binding proteins, family3) domains, HisKA domain, HATPase c domain and response regulator receiver domain [Candidatus Magnetococcus massalia]
MLCMLLVQLPHLATAADASLKLTPEEQAWLKAHPTLRVAVLGHLAPYDFITGHKQMGFSIDFVKLISQQLGSKIEYINSSSHKAYRALLKDRKADLLAHIIPTKATDPYTLYSPPYTQQGDALVVRRNDTFFSTTEDLYGRKLAVRHHSGREALLKQSHPSIQRIVVKSVQEGLERVAQGEADAYWDANGPIVWHLRTNMVQGLRIAGHSGLTTPDQTQIRLGIRSDEPILQTLVTKAMARLDKVELAKLYDKWSGLPLPQSQKGPLALSQAEQRYLLSKQSITMCVDPDWMPYEAIDAKGRHIGMAAEYIQLLSQRIHTPIEVVPTKSWTESLEVGKRRGCDIFSLLNKTEERTKFLNFTAPYVEAPSVLVTRDDQPFVNGLGDMRGRKLSVPKGYVYEEKLRRYHPEIQLVTVSSVREGLSRVSQGEVFAHLGSLYVVVNQIQRSAFSNLKISGTTQYGHQLAVGVRNDDPTLLRILSSAVDSITAQEHIRIRRTWTATKFEHTSYDDLLVKVLVMSAVIILGVFLWNRKLNRLNRQIRDSEDRYRTLLQTVPDAVVVHHEGQIDFVNETMVKLIKGPDQQQMLGSSIEKLCQVDDESQLKQLCANDPSNDGSIPLLELQLLCNNQESLPVEAKSRAIQWGGKPATLTVFRDISERIRTRRDLLLAKREADKASQAKSHFLAAMSHDIRTPMNAIIGMADILKHSPLNDEQKHHVEVLNRAGEGLLALINEILDLSKIESNQLVLDRIPYALPALIRETIHIMAYQAEEKGLILEIHHDENLPTWLWGDHQRIRQILLNFLSNAVKFTDRGLITVHVEPHRDKEQVQIRVQDSGVGIPREMLAHIFDPFQQLEEQTSMRAGGTGLGLTICRQLVERMDGKIGVDSQVGQGSTFWFTLPLDEAPAPRANMEPQAQQLTDGSPQQQTVQPMRVLLADDSLDNQILMRAYFKRSIHSLVVVDDGGQAVEQFKHGGIDMVLMDIQMPILNGHQATRLIRTWERENRLPPTPIIALTANAMKEDAEKALASGCDMHLTKPIKRGDLMEAIESWQQR